MYVHNSMFVSNVMEKWLVELPIPDVVKTVFQYKFARIQKKNGFDKKEYRNQT